jgi:hypothetical protein
MFGRNFGRFLLVLVAVVGVFVLAGLAYQAGINALATQLPAPAAGGATNPAVVPYYGYGHPFGWGFGIFGFLFFLLFLFLIFGVIRAFAWGGRGRGWGGPGRWGGWYGGGGPWMGGPGGMGPGGRSDADNAERWRNSPWGQRAHDVFEDWHREAHAEKPDTPGGPGTSPQPPASGPGSTGQA